MILKKQLYKPFLWIIAIAAIMVVFVFAKRTKTNRLCKGVTVEIVSKDNWLSEKNIQRMIEKKYAIKGKPISELDLRAIEQGLEKNAWIKNAEGYTNNQNEIVIKITERNPIARIFTQDNHSFYIDSTGYTITLDTNLLFNEYKKTNIPLFTNYPINSIYPKTKADSLLIKDIFLLGQKIVQDSFWNAQIAQVYITGDRSFELIPTLGEHIIIFGSSEAIDKKFNKIYTFYKKIWLQEGVGKYDKIDVQYANQIIAVKSGTNLFKSDTALAAKTLAQMMINNGNIDSGQAMIAVPTAAANISITEKNKGFKASAIKKINAPNSSEKIKSFIKKNEAKSIKNKTQPKRQKATMKLKNANKKK